MCLGACNAIHTQVWRGRSRLLQALRDDPDHLPLAGQYRRRVRHGAHQTDRVSHRADRVRLRQPGCRGRRLWQTVEPAGAISVNMHGTAIDPSGWRAQGGWRF